MNELLISGYRFLKRVDKDHTLLENVRTGFIVVYNSKYNTWKNLYFDGESKGIPWSA